MELLKLLSANELVAQIINFLILLLLLRLFFWKPVLKALDERKRKIHEELKRIEENKAETESLRSKYETQLDYIEEEARARVNQALDEAKKMTDEMKKEAHEESQKIIDSSRQEVKYQVAKAREELKGEIIELTLKSTRHLINEKLTAEGDKKLVEDFLQDLEKTE